jgi:hypothetical protein
MFVTIKFNRDCYIVAQDTAGSMPYPYECKKDEIEHVDLLNQAGQTLYVQFEDGAVGWIKSRYVEIIHEGPVV